MNEEGWFRDVNLDMFYKDCAVLEEEVCVGGRAVEMHAWDIRRRYGAIFEASAEDLPPIAAYWRDYFRTQFGRYFDYVVVEEERENVREFMALMRRSLE